MNTNILLLSIVVIVLLCLISWLIFKKYRKPVTIQETIVHDEVKEKKPFIEFVSREYFNNIVDNAQYFNRMNQIDLNVRDSININSYKKLYKDGYKEFTDIEKNILKSVTNRLNELLKDDYKNIYSIPWKFAKLDYNLENGYPHTHGDIIVVSMKFFDLDKNIMAGTLLHEKIHVYQRQFPLYTERLISLWNFKLIDRLENYNEARNNPDINNFVYAYKDKPFLQIYNSANSTNISDSAVYFYTLGSKNVKENSTNNANTNKDNTKEKESIVTPKDLDIPLIITQYEHPYEIMASFLPRLIIDHYTDNSEFTQKTIHWLSQYF